MYWYIATNGGKVGTVVADVGGLVAPARYASGPPLNCNGPLALDRLVLAVPESWTGAPPLSVPDKLPLMLPACMAMEGAVLEYSLEKAPGVPNAAPEGLVVDAPVAADNVNPPPGVSATPANWTVAASEPTALDTLPIATMPTGDS